MENNALNDILRMTAWSMDTPQLFGSFHIAASAVSAAFAVLAAALLARRFKAGHSVFPVLSVTGLVMVFLEIYKQLFLYHIVNDGAFDFWFFPFQLCSVPMYLCILLPAFGKRLQTVLMTFMGGYSFISALAALIYPEDILRPFLTLTAHGFIWHGLLLFISLFIVFTGHMDVSFKGLRNAAALFVTLSCIALAINILVEPVMPAIRSAHPSVAHSWAAMFYLNPFHISPQPVVNLVQESAGIPAGLILYIAAVIAAGSAACYVLSHFSVLDDSRAK